MEGSKLDTEVEKPFKEHLAKFIKEVNVILEKSNAYREIDIPLLNPDKISPRGLYELFGPNGNLTHEPYFVSKEEYLIRKLVEKPTAGTTNDLKAL